MYGGDIGKSPARLCRPMSDQYGVAAEPIYRRKTVLIGHVISEKGRGPPLKGWLLEEGFDGRTLVRPRRAQFDHGFPRYRHEGWVRPFSQGDPQALGLFGTVRCAAEVERQASRFTLQQGAGVAIGKEGEARFHLGEVGRQDGEGQQAAGRIPAFEAVLSGGGQVQRCKKPIQVAERASTHQRNCPVQLLPQAGKGIHQPGRDNDLVRTLGNLQQAAVNVEEDGPLLAGWGRLR